MREIGDKDLADIERLLEEGSRPVPAIIVRALLARLRRVERELAALRPPGRGRQASGPPADGRAKPDA